ncbi:hypothetical protein GC173_05965 [bacterium]|nr:hypothetical protein [bacterium]
MKTCRKTFIALCALALLVLLTTSAHAVWIPTPGHDDTDPRWITINVNLVDTVSGKGVIRAEKSAAASSYLAGSEIELRWKDTGTVFLQQTCSGSGGVVGISSQTFPPLPVDATPGREYEYTYTIPSYGVIEGECFVNFAMPDLRNSSTVEALTIGVPVDATGWDLDIVRSNSGEIGQNTPYTDPSSIATVSFMVMEDTSQAGVLIPSMCVPNMVDIDSTATLTFTDHLSSLVAAVYPYRDFYGTFPHDVKAFWCTNDYPGWPWPYHPAVYPDYPADFVAPNGSLVTFGTQLRPSTAMPTTPVTFTVELEGYETVNATVTLPLQHECEFIAVTVPTPAAKAAVFDTVVKALAAPAATLSAQDWLLYQ